jgi:hypothetical protein
VVWWTPARFASRSILEEAAMTGNARKGPRLSHSLRILSALVAVLALLDMWQWSHGNRLQVAYGLTGALAWGSLEYWGDRPGWSRYVTAALLAAFAALAAGRLAGVPWA